MRPGRDVTERVLAEAALRESEDRFRTIVNTANEGIWAVDAQGRTILANPRLSQLLATPLEALPGRSLTGFCFADDLDAASEHLRANLAGQTEESEFRFRRGDGTAIHVLAATAPLKGPEGEIVGALGGYLDLTERKRAEVWQRTLLRETAHRGKNLMAVVQSIAGRTLTGSRSLAEAHDAFVGRLHALARTYASLTEAVFKGARLEEIVANELGSVAGPVRVGGPSIMVEAKAARTLALTLHELATNAAKYGALSVPTGHVNVAWRLGEINGERRFIFDWIESGGPPAKQPSRRGFGTVLISRVAGAELGCTPELSYGGQGFSYRLNAALTAVGRVIDEAATPAKPRSVPSRDFHDAWDRFEGGGEHPPL